MVLKMMMCSKCLDDFHDSDSHSHHPTDNTKDYQSNIFSKDPFRHGSSLKNDVKRAGQDVRQQRAPNRASKCYEVGELGSEYHCKSCC